MRPLKAFLIGSVAAGVLAYGVAAGLAVVAQTGGRSLELAIGPLRIVSVVLRPHETATTFGAGLLVLAVAGGVANLAVALWIARRARPPVDRVD
jgi:hypothetical protein